MNWFINLSIKKKIITIFSVINSMILMIYFYWLYDVSTLLEKEKTIEIVEMSLLRNTQSINANLNNLFNTYFKGLSKSSGQKIIGASQIDSLKEVNSVLFSKSNEISNEDEIKEKLNELKLINDKFFQFAFENTNNLSQSNYVTGLMEIKDAQESAFNSVLDILKNRIHQKILSSEEHINSEIILFLFLVGGFIVVASFFALKSHNVIGRPIVELTKVANLIAKGDLSVQIEKSSRTDEIGILQTSFRSMVYSIRLITKQLKDSAETLNKSAEDLQQSISQLASSSAETAASISETSATVEEAKQTSSISTLKAKEVSEKAFESAEIALSGKKITDETVEGINLIGKEMDIIATRIVSLSEQSKAIGEIISSVKDLSEQSNLLAVNASIEAARAGEHGKGFSVVAQEIKNLSDQSKQAMGQIKIILNDVQDSIGQAVLQTEKASKAVLKGIGLINQTGEVISELDDSINIAAEAAAQIAASNQEQEIGMSQISTAMNNIKTASNQNADVSRQIEDSVNLLKDINDKIKVILSNFNLN